MIIDTHVHVWEIDPPMYPIGPTAPSWDTYPDEAGTALELVEEMDLHGVDRAVLVQASWSTWDNGYIADSIDRFPGRFIGQGLVNPEDPDNADMIRYWMNERGLSGFRLHPIYYPDEQVLVDPKNEPMWEEMSALNAIVQLHVRPEFAGQLLYIAQRYGGLKLIIDHMGYPDIKQSVAAFAPIIELAVYENFYLKLSDVAGRSEMCYPFEDVHPFIRRLLRAFGADRIIWGTGYPGRHRAKHGWLSLDQELLLIQEGIPFLTGDSVGRILGRTAETIWR